MVENILAWSASDKTPRHSLASFTNWVIGPSLAGKLEPKAMRSAPNTETNLAKNARGVDRPVLDKTKVRGVIFRKRLPYPARSKRPCADA